jgi:seryl-tRNA synthetase
MHDIRTIRDNPEAFDAALAKRGLSAQSAHLLAIDAKRREVMTRAQELQAKRNQSAKEIGQKKAKGEDVEALLAAVAKDKAAESEAESEAKNLEVELEKLLSTIPNLPAADVPLGTDESGNVEIRKVGTPPSFDFKPLLHDELGPKLKLMDFDGAAKLSGARFVVLKGALARLERALGQFMLDIHTGELGYTEINPPILVRDEALYGTGQLPKFGDDLFRTAQGHWMIPTAEVPLTNLAAGEIIDEEKLPIRMTALTACFRSEAGAAGKDTRGMIRQHQFQKVELVSIAHPDHSDAEHERMTSCAEEVLKRLGLAYRVMTLCSGDMGFSARKTYDIEVWLPGQDCYREISSCSNCGDFQALRMKARFKPKGGKGTRAVHTLNGSGLAVGRTLIAVMENYQQADGSIKVPEALRPYMGKIEAIKPDV